MTTHEHEGRRRPLPVRWDGTINYGHLLMTLTLLITGLVAWFDQRAATQQNARDLQDLSRHVEREQARDQASIAEIKLEVGRQGEQTRAAIERIGDKLDRKMDKP